MLFKVYFRPTAQEFLQKLIQASIPIVRKRKIAQNNSESNNKEKIAKESDTLFRRGINLVRSYFFRP